MQRRRRRVVTSPPAEDRVRANDRLLPVHRSIVAVQSSPKVVHGSTTFWSGLMRTRRVGSSVRHRKSPRATRRRSGRDHRSRAVLLEPDGRPGCDVRPADERSHGVGYSRLRRRRLPRGRCVRRPAGRSAPGLGRRIHVHRAVRWNGPLERDPDRLHELPEPRAARYHRVGVLVRRYLRRRFGRCHGPSSPDVESAPTGAAASTCARQRRA